ncbi:ATP synthase subunit I [Fusobacterium nucleatum subsp. nucleatum]|uniref:ATP synthase subunit I n=1 Tax=Fusobacterium nucleatum subsp. nucleatum TaxID=76856 RepID=A0A101K6C0_FUSNC|nr:ATP synthase subunit I [Fusobacterium nucleatum]ALF23813.1 ATP synthase subunit I [Fusobacterium nucleatum subsp. nucleatum ChDC F316]KUL98141.1 ATP synthase subunit I [Fusobacterium nucleatum subsp. nucleatum]
MEEIKKLFKITIIVTIVTCLLGLIFQNKYLLFGISGGCAISVIALYMLSLDSKTIVYSKDVKVAKRIAYIGYAKRYFLHLLFLGTLLYFTNDFQLFLSGFIGTLNVKLSIYFMNILRKIKSLLK